MSGGSPRWAVAMAMVMAVHAIAACGSDDDDDASNASQDGADTTAGPTECLSGEGDMSTTITFSVDDPRDGFGFVSSRAPSGLTAGTVRVELESDPENEDPLDLPLLKGEEEVFRFVGVEPGTTCGVELDLAAGSYRVAIGDNDAEFTIGE